MLWVQLSMWRRQREARVYKRASVLFYSFFLADLRVCYSMGMPQEEKQWVMYCRSGFSSKLFEVDIICSITNSDQKKLILGTMASIPFKFLLSSLFCLKRAIRMKGLLKNELSLFVFSMQQLSLVERIVCDLARHKHYNYHQDTLTTLYQHSSYLVDELITVTNPFKERLRCTLLKHRPFPKHPHSNTVCILYLHGLGSNRLQGLTLLPHLPKKYCLCVVDLSGSGKSGGQYVTYGMKEQEDIGPVIEMLSRKKFIREFVVWGRSMGAVATLLYAIQHHSQQQNSKGRCRMLSLTSKRRESEKKGGVQWGQDPIVKAIVLDSPFQNFTDIALHIASSKLHIPSFIADLTLCSIRQAFSTLLARGVGQQYNPFLIDFKQPISLTLPILLMFSPDDEVIPQYHTFTLCNMFHSKHYKVQMRGCMHNDQRTSATLTQAITMLQKITQAESKLGDITDQLASRDLNSSLEKRKGISLLTKSKEKGKSQSSLKKFHEVMTIDVVRTEEQAVRANKSKSCRKSLVTLGMTERPSKRKDFDTIDSQTNQGLTNINSMQLACRQMLTTRIEKKLGQNPGLRGQKAKTRRITLMKGEKPFFKH